MTDRSALTPANAKAPELPFSAGVRAGNTVQVSGQGPTDPETGAFVFQGDVKAQTVQVLQNVESVLKAGGAGFDDVIMLRVYLTTRDHFSAMNEAYAEYLTGRCESGVLPSRTTVMVGLPHPDMLVEIDALAVVA
ncbi:RidA family protein [Kineosporia succinea]|uniref:Reactive intermediate/imine deaminase n=1 Tax=Kineosporia succinea TaxID=84632 RepID=A0ABT9P7D7_9ACTN|nr:RidA family protein [Kineosporia succinea]MDP9828613.1 reactive intermediate/imine deaminase [Kineosporia succinea]